MQLFWLECVVKGTKGIGSIAEKQMIAMISFWSQFCYPGFYNCFDCF